MTGMKRKIQRSLLMPVAAALLLCGIGESYGESPYAIRDPKVPKNLSAAARARLMRTDQLKKKADLKKYILEAVKKEHQGGPDQTPKGVAK
jgi:hypothetical protein